MDSTGNTFFYIIENLFCFTELLLVQGLGVGRYYKRMYSLMQKKTTDSSQLMSLKHVMNYILPVLRTPKFGPWPASLGICDVSSSLPCNYY
jgi:hypothetical protein